MIGTDFSAISLLLSPGFHSPVTTLRIACVKVVGTLLRTALPKSRLDMSYDTSGEGVSWKTNGGVDTVSSSISWMTRCMRALLSCANDVEVEVMLVPLLSSRNAE